MSSTEGTRIPREEYEAQVVATRFPPRTRTADLAGFRGWNFPVICRLGSRYVMRIIWDHTVKQYRVALIEPAAEKDPVSAHDNHVFKDGYLCLGTRYAHSFEYVYSQAIMWATGYSIMKATGKFPFNFNQ